MTIHSGDESNGLPIVSSDCYTGPMRIIIYYYCFHLYLLPHEHYGIVYGRTQQADTILSLRLHGKAIHIEMTCDVIK